MAAYIIPFKGFEKGFIHAVSERVAIASGVLSSSITEHPADDSSRATTTAEIWSRVASNLVYLHISLEAARSNSALLADILQPALSDLKETLRRAAENSTVDDGA